VSDIFISYSSADRPRVKPLVDALHEQGWSVWWDRTILAGNTWDRVIETALTDARCVIVLWSRDSIQSDWVRTEADEAQRRGILVPAMLDDVKIPLAFRRIQAASLVAWSGALPSAEFDELARAVSQVLSNAASPALEATTRRAGATSATTAAPLEVQHLERGEVFQKADEEQVVAEASGSANAEGAAPKSADEQRLTLLILTPFLLAAGVLTVLLTGILVHGSRFTIGLAVARALSVLPLAGAVTVVCVNLRKIARGRGHGAVGVATVCIIFEAYILGAFRFYLDPLHLYIILFVLSSALQWIGGFRLCYRSRHQGGSGWPYLVGIPLVCTVFTGTLLWAVSRLTGTWYEPDVEWLRIVFGPPLILVVVMCGTTLQIGLMGLDFPAGAREWLARLGASVFMGMAGWTGLSVLAVFGPYWLACVTLGWAQMGIAMAGGWIANGLVWSLSGKGAKTAGGRPEVKADRQTRVLAVVGGAAPLVFLAGFLLFISLSTHLLLRAVVGTEATRANCVVPVTGAIPDWLLWLEPVQREYWCFLYYSHHGLLMVVAVLLAGCLLMITLLLRNINASSMHYFYNNRLVRGLLGRAAATNGSPTGH
jgi:hypothetical protein